tara:strand:+ start:984 stop:1421 length:438 start_codon:yes stop_codon:yes gene_type:complete
MNYTKKNNRKNNFTKKNIKNHKTTIRNNIKEIINLVKSYNWKTKSHFKKQVNDELYNKLDIHTEQFIEELVANNEDKIMKKFDKEITKLKNKHEIKLKDKVYEFRNMLKNIVKPSSRKKNTNLFLLRDVLLLDINQFLYLIIFDS